MEFDFLTIAVGLATLSIGIAGTMMAGGGLFGDEVANKAKKSIPNIILGVIMVAVASTVITSMFGGL